MGDFFSGSVIGKMSCVLFMENMMDAPTENSDDKGADEFKNSKGPGEERGTDQ